MTGYSHIADGHIDVIKETIRIVIHYLLSANIGKKKKELTGFFLNVIIN